jgi:Protein of unknown function (DUF1360)
LGLTLPWQDWRVSSGNRSTSRESGIDEETTKPVDYALINAVYGALLAGVLVAARDREGGRELTDPQELVPLGAATFALSKIVAREKVGSWMREPFVEQQDGTGRRPRGRRLRHAVGELLTCSRCVGAWSALGLVGLRLASPSAGRVATGVLATSALNDFLQAAFRALCEQASAAGS